MEEYDYCDNCERKIEQIDLGDGSFGCPHCLSDNDISIISVHDELCEMLEKKVK